MLGSTFNRRCVKGSYMSPLYFKPRRARVDAMVMSKTLATSYLIHPFFSGFWPQGPYNTFFCFLAVKKRRQDDPMTTRFFLGIKLRPLRTDFWREKIRPNFFRGRLNRTPVKGTTCESARHMSCRTLRCAICLSPSCHWAIRSPLTAPNLWTSTRLGWTERTTTMRG